MHARLALPAVWALLPATALAQFSEPRPLVDSVATPRAVLTLDVDLDGDQDLVSIASEGGRIVWFEARGPLGLAAPRTLIDGLVDPRDVAAGDADGDGDLDLLIADAANASALYVENLGPAGFAAPVPLAVLLFGFDTVALDDADADGDLDAVVLFPGGIGLSAMLFVMPNDGTGAFGAATDILPSPVTQVGRAELRDIDGDGRTDALFGREFVAGALLYLRSTTSGTLAPPFALNPDFGQFVFDTGDVDADGDIDVVTGRMGAAVVHLNDGTGQLGAPTALMNSNRMPEEIFLTDLDLDGDDDVLVAQGPQPRLVLHEALGGGAFGPQRVLSTDPLADFTVATAADFDADGAIDVAFGTAGFLQAVEPNQVAWRRGNGLSGLPFLGAPTRLSAPLSAAIDAAAVDLDGDGDRDMIGVAVAQPRVAAFEARGIANFDPFEPTNIAQVSLRPVAAGDFNRNGLEDLLAIEGNGELVVRSSAGVGQFEPPISLGTIYIGADPIAFDVDGDLDLDVIAAESSASISLFENFGLGLWAPSVRIDMGMVRPSGLASGDLDGDGDRDLVLATLGPQSGIGSGEVLWYEWTGSSFGDGTLISAAPFDAAGVAVGDVDGDGTLDVAWGRQNGGNSAWARGLGGGAFASAVPLVSVPTGGAEALALIDGDGDGDADLVTLRPGGLLRWYESLGDGTFDPAFRSIESRVERFRATEVDLDGDEDLIGARVDAGEVFWVENPSFDEVGAPYCGPAIPNATGLSGCLQAVGTDIAGANVLTLRALDLPRNTFGFFLNSRVQGVTFPVVNSIGRLCLSGPIGRYVGPGEVGFSGDDGFFTLRLDLSETPTPNGFVPAVAGQAWNFQAWHRDVAGGTVTSNFTDAVSIVLR
ncbi:MAG: VCBS repeat-containing protein [Planctomycetota bacterium]